MNDKYNLIQLEAEVMEADSHRLIQMMLEKCVKQIHFARHCMDKNEIANKTQAISKCMDIIDYLRLMLNKDSPETKLLSQQLETIYLYVNSRLMKANVKNDPALLEEALSKIVKIKSAWDTINVGVEA